VGGGGVAGRWTKEGESLDKIYSTWERPSAKETQEVQARPTGQLLKLVIGCCSGRPIQVSMVTLALPQGCRWAMPCSVTVSSGDGWRIRGWLS
jgi:hypothetical protein